MRLTEESPGPSLHPRELAIYLLLYSFNATEGWDGLSFGYQLSTFSKVKRFDPNKPTLNSVQFKIIIIIKLFELDTTLGSLVMGDQYYLKLNTTLGLLIIGEPYHLRKFSE